MTPADSPSGRSDWSLIPNWLSAGRIAAAALLPVCFLAFDRATAAHAALALFIAASITDFFDGWLARALNQTSALGAKLDSWADKALLTATLLTYGVASLGGAPAAAQIWFWAVTAAILGREAAVTALRMRHGRAGGLSVSTAAKWKTAAQMTGAALLLTAEPAATIVPAATANAVFWAGAALLTLGAALGVSSGIGYWRRATRHL